MSENSEAPPSPHEDTPIKEHLALPDFVLPQDLRTRYQQSIVGLAEETTFFDTSENHFKLRADAPQLFISPLRSGPIVKSGYDAYCDTYSIPQPPTLEVVGIGSETRDTFLQAMQRDNPDFDPDEWESDEVQARFREWIAEAKDPAVAQAIAAIKSQAATMPDDQTELKIMFVDDAGGEYGDVRNRVAPAILSASLGSRPFSYEYYLMFPKKYFDERGWHDWIVEATFGKDLPFAQREFLCETVRGSFDNLYQRQDVLLDFEEEAEKGNYPLDSIRRFRILAEVTRRDNQDFFEIAYPGRIAENGLDPLLEKYGEGLIDLKPKLMELLKNVGKASPEPKKH